MLSDRQHKIVRRVPSLVASILLVASTLALGLLSLPGGRWPLLALVTFVPLGLALHNSSRTRCFICAYACGVLGWIASTGGLVAGLSSYSRVSSAASALLVAVSCICLALPYGIFGFLYGRFQWMNGRRGALKTAACLTLLLSFFPSPLPVDSSHALYGFPLLVQMLDLGGQPLVLFTLLLINWLLVDLVLRVSQRRNYWSSAGWIASICILVVSYGYFRLARLRTEEGRASPDRVLRVALVQPNIPLEGDSNFTYASNPFHTLLDQSASLFTAGHQIDLVVWPETPIRINCEESGSLRPGILAIVARYGVPFLINCAQPAGEGKDYNTQLLITPGGRTYAYHKQILFPFTEYVPGERWVPELKTLLPGASHYAAARESTVLPVKDSLGVFPAICYEILFPGHPREFIRRGGNVMISPANDAWFGKTRIPEFQIAEGVYQAVQYRIPVLRVSNSGNSVAIKASGEIVPGSRTQPFTKTTRVVEVVAPRTRSPYFLIGNVFLYALALGWTVSVALDFLREKKRFRREAVGYDRDLLRPTYDDESLSS